MEIAYMDESSCHYFGYWEYSTITTNQPFYKLYGIFRDAACWKKWSFDVMANHGYNFDRSHIS